jgi:outer membrane receptor for ferrienterochelin and colicin
MFRKSVTDVLKAAVFVATGCYGQLVSASENQSAPQTQLAPAQPNEVQRVEVSGNGEIDQRKASSTIKTIVTSIDIARFGDTSISDVLRRVAGISLTGAPGRTGEIRMRGLGGGYTQILINGEPTAPGFSPDSLLPSVIQRIEIQSAPTAEMSAQSIAGSINFVLKQVVRRERPELKLRVAAYDGNTSYYIDGQSSDQLGDLTYTVAGGLSSEENTWPSLIEQTGLDAMGNPIMRRTTRKTERANTDTLNLTPRINWKLDGGDVLSAEMLVQARRTRAGVIDTRTTTLGDPALYASNDLALDIDMNSVQTKLNWKHKFSVDSTIDIKTGLRYQHRKSIAKFFGFDELGSVVLDEDTHSGATDASLTLSGKYRTSYLVNHAIAMGWDGERSSRTEDRVQQQSAPFGYPAANLNESYDARVDRLALFAQDEWDIASKISAYTGIRWEGLQTHSVGNTFQGITNRSGVISPLAQVVWKLPDSGNDQVRIGFNRTYKAPSTRDLMPRRYVANDNTPTTPDLQGNPNLRPELAWGMDIVYEHFFGKAGLVSIGANVRRIENVILRQITNVDGKWISSPLNDGDAKTHGLDLESKLNLAKLDASLPDMDIRASSSWNWSSVQSVPGPNNRLDKQIPFNANLGADYRVITYPLTVGGSFNFQRGVPVRLSANQTSVMGTKRIVDMYALWKFSPNTQTRFVVSNVLAQDYVDEADYFDEYGRTHQVTMTPSKVTIKLSLEHKF